MNEPENVEPMHPALIQAELSIAETTQRDIADELNVTESMVSLVINGKGKSQRVASFIANKIGKPVSKIWPGVYSDSTA